MTDKQIIIDGVDISKCKHYDEEFNYCDQSYLGEGGLLKNTKNPKRCEYSPNCYYKQLKRKEQECERLKKQVCSLRQELKSMIDEACCKHNIETKTYHKKIVEIINNLDQLKQTLVEIKENCRNLFFYR